MVNSWNNRWNGGGQTITCSSDDGEPPLLLGGHAGWRADDQSAQRSPCQQGYSWGYDQRGIWVDHGCRADFQVR